MRLVSGRTNGGALGVLVLLLVVLPLLVSGALVQRGQKKTSEDRTLAFEAAQQAANVADYFARARSLTQILAKNPAFAEFYELPGRRLERIRGDSAAVRQSNAALAYLETLFPGSIGEACFIDAGGAENARAVKGRIESIANLSPDETGASFFRPSFRLRSGEVYQSRPYVSPDTHEWVIANSAPIDLPGRSTPAIVHFEVTLESLRRAAADLSERYDIQIVDTRSGRAVVDTRYPFVDARISEGLRVRALPHGAAAHTAGLLTVDGHRLAFQRLTRVGQNANDWVIVARSRTPIGGWLGTVNIWQVAILLIIAGLIPLAFLSWRRSQTDLTRAAHTDGLTGLGNRRLLMQRLERAAASATSERPLLVAMYDLDGFKHYNDLYGHPAGDALLSRLARGLAVGLRDVAEAYRMGGDEFCVVAELDDVGDSLNVATLAASALCERGEGFNVTASYGAVLVPLDTIDSRDALRIADQRMYAQKSGSRLSALRQTTDVLVQMTAERSAELGEHASEVAQLAEAVAVRLGMNAERAEIVRAANLHDIGKLAIPESILHKPGPLTPEEWFYVRQHTIIGERILAAAPSLSRCGAIVRATHEAWDGTGYPDGLAGEEIPLEARIIAVCDAFQAMTSQRPYEAARNVDEAVAELRRCAGTQFDPHVVRVFVDVLSSGLEDAGHPEDDRSAA